jgi:hypothetical protein
VAQAPAAGGGGRHGERMQAIPVALRGVAQQAGRGGALVWHAAHPAPSPLGRPPAVEEWPTDVDAGERGRVRHLVAARPKARP